MRKLLAIIALIPFLAGAQSTTDLDDVKPGRFDQGKMWTFENPPVAYFQEAYGFTPTEEWMEDIRKSAIRFASWCSGSFVSESGLIMTNHHCSRSVVASVMKEGENFDENGFYAETQVDERKVPDLYVDQMVMALDITKEINAQQGISEDSALSVVKAKYAALDDWKDLVLETRTFYSGGRYSLYGFKRYSDIRLVLYPEVAMGYFGGDPDNFTYPRYNLDFTFFRAYDDDGQPLIPSNYFSFKPNGAAENEPIFVIGNPGSTGRYETMSQLYFQRDVSAPAIISLLSKRKDILLKAAEMEEDVYKKDSIVNLAFSFSNSEKAYTGRLEGLNDPYLMTKKEKKEEELRKNMEKEGNSPWDEIEDNEKEATGYYPDLIFLSPSASRGKINKLLHELFSYKIALQQENEKGIQSAKDNINVILKGFDKNLEAALFTAELQDLSDHSRQSYLDEVLAGKTPSDKVTELMNESMVLNNLEDFYSLKAKKLDKEPLMKISEIFVPKFMEAAGKMRAISQENKELEKKVMNLSFQLSGVSSPPDATFSLRLSDGVVKGYEYNGTEAPYKTTFYGLYDRYYSNDGEYPWNLPERWLNPSSDLLKQPMNFVCTADIIGGNSGSPVINKDAEVVGLVFDGNIESLPGYFIFDDEYNRTVAVHAGGIVAALKYVYKAERLLPELNAE